MLYIWYAMHNLQLTIFLCNTVTCTVTLETGSFGLSMLVVCILYVVALALQFDVHSVLVWSAKISLIQAFQIN